MSFCPFSPPSHLSILPFFFHSCVSCFLSAALFSVYLSPSQQRGDRGELFITHDTMNRQRNTTHTHSCTQRTDNSKQTDLTFLSTLLCYNLCVHTFVWAGKSGTLLCVRYSFNGYSVRYGSNNSLPLRHITPGANYQNANLFYVSILLK